MYIQWKKLDLAPVSDVDRVRTDSIFTMQSPIYSCYLNKTYSNQAMDAFLVLFIQNLHFFKLSLMS